MVLNSESYSINIYFKSWMEVQIIMMEVIYGPFLYWFSIESALTYTAIIMSMQRVRLRSGFEEYLVNGLVNRSQTHNSGQGAMCTRCASSHNQYSIWYWMRPGCRELMNVSRKDSLSACISSSTFYNDISVKVTVRCTRRIPLTSFPSLSWWCSVCDHGLGLSSWATVVMLSWAL